MIIKDQKVEIRWGRTNVRHYRQLGYNYTKLGEPFWVRVEDLMPNSKARVEIICDQCGKKCFSTYQSYLNSIASHKEGYFCKYCVQTRSETQTKRKATCLNKYGYENPALCEEIQEKTRQTNLQKTGYNYPTQSPAVKEKVKQSFEINQSFCGFQNPEVLAKAQQKISENSLHKTSTQQNLLFQKLKEYYADADECILNKPCSSLNLDIALSLKREKLDIEVDGAYWHQDSTKDRRRDEYVKQQGYKVLRIKINHKLPPFSEICEGINKLIASEHTYFVIEAKDIKTNKKI